MGVCRRIVKEYVPSELTITVTIWSEPRKAPRFQQWEVKKAGCPPRIIPCSMNATSSKHRAVWKTTPNDVAPKVTVADDVASREKQNGGVTMEMAPETKKLLRNASFDLLSNGDVAMPIMELVQPGTPKKQILRRKKKKSKTPEDTPRYREFTETTVNMYVEMEKQNLGEFVWDQQCTRIDALVAPIVELDRTTTPEIPVEVEIID